jgi:hypothetical protein
MLWVLEDLFALGAMRLNSLKRSTQVSDMEVEVDWGPMALELAPVGGSRRRLGAGRFFE